MGASTRPRTVRRLPRDSRLLSAIGLLRTQIRPLPNVAAKVIEVTGAKRAARVRGDAQAHPTRVFAKAVVNVAWRNGPIEEIHGGKTYPFGESRS